jgi:cephalosporin-C deacetylase
MAAHSHFDEIFRNLPSVETEKDYDRFWLRAESELKRISMNAESKVSGKHSTRFNIYDLSFRSIQNTVITGSLWIPKAIDKPRPVIIIHDYNHPEPYKGFHMDDSFAYYFLQLRGHDHIKETAVEKTPAQNTVSKRRQHETEFPGYLQESILDAEDYYVKNLCCDALRAIDALRLNRKLDCGAVGIIGKGIGALAASFAASRSNRVRALILDSPIFAWLDESQNESESDAACEINDYIKNNNSRKPLVKKVLSYFDIIPLAKDISCDLMMSIGLKDKIAPPKCSLALFNHFLCDKEIQIYPDDGNEAGSEKQFRKAQAWLRERIC